MNDQTDHAPLIDQRLNEIENLLSVVTRNRVTTFVERDEADAHWFVHSAKYATELLAEVRDLRERIANARAEIARQNDAGQGELGSGACDAVDAYLVDPQHRPERHRSPGYPHELPDHHGPADTCAMPACVTARAQHEAAADIQDLTYELLADREPKAGA